MVVVIRNYIIGIHGRLEIRAEKDPVDGAWALSSDPPGFLEQILLANLRTKREKK
jgi:hypothetical protein